MEVGEIAFSCRVHDLIVMLSAMPGQLADLVLEAFAEVWGILRPTPLLVVNDHVREQVDRPSLVEHHEDLRVHEWL